MSSQQLLLSAFGGFREVAIFDDANPRDMIVKTFEDCEPIIARAKMLSEMNPGKEFRHVMERKTRIEMEFGGMMAALASI